MQLTLVTQRLLAVIAIFFVCFWVSTGQTQGKARLTHQDRPRAKGRLRVGEAVRFIPGYRMSFLTKNRRTSPQDARDDDEFPAAQLGLLGMALLLQCP